jgi:CBS domain-containing protein
MTALDRARARDDDQRSVNGEVRMNVAAILRAKGTTVLTVHPGATVAMAAHRISAGRIGCLVVSRDDVTVDGLVTERDLVRALARYMSDAPGLRVGDVMSVDVPICHPEDDLTAVMRTMTRRRYRHLPVVDNNRLVGLVSIGDVVKHRLEELELERSVLRDAYVATR